MSDNLSLTGDSTLGDVIAGFEQETDPDRQLQAALSHVDAELGSMPLRNVRSRHIAALLDDLHDAGLSPRRETAVVEAVGSVFAFARDRGVTDVDPVPAYVPHAGGPRETPPAAVPVAHTTTLTMLALGNRVASWTAVAIVLVFAALFLVLIVELA
jgi:hypothetical protein